MNVTMNGCSVVDQLFFDDLQMNRFYKVTGKQEGDPSRCTYKDMVGFVVEIDGTGHTKRFVVPEVGCVLNVDKWDYTFKEVDSSEMVIAI